MPLITVYLSCGAQIMGTTKREGEKIDIVGRHRQGQKPYHISKELQLSRRFVDRTINHWKRFQTIADQKRSGRKPIVTKKIKGLIESAITGTRKSGVRTISATLKTRGLHVSKSTVARTLKSIGKKFVIGNLKPLLTAEARLRRLVWVKKRIADKDDMSNVVFSDEKWFISGDVERGVWIDKTEKAPFVERSTVPRSS
jgi:transposase